MSTDTLQTPRTTLRRRPQRGAYDRASIDAILDAGLVCHLGFVAEGQPFVIPTIYARIGDVLYVHGAAASRMLKTIGAEADVCLTVTLVDGLVLARSAFHHSMNYRSVVVLGRARAVVDSDERGRALRAIVEHVLAGRWQEVREPSPQELRATSVVALPLAEASAKIRAGGPIDDEEDYALPVWAGHVPLALTRGEPIADARLASGIPVSASVRALGAARLRPR